MIEKIMKAVKSSNKKERKKYNDRGSIGFLLSCTAVMGADSYLWIKGDSGKIEFNKKTVDGDGSCMEIGIQKIHMKMLEIFGIQVLKLIQTIRHCHQVKLMGKDGTMI